MNTKARLLAAIPVFLIALAGCSEEPSSARVEQPEKPVVTVAEVNKWDYPQTRQLPGIVRPGNRAVLSTRVAGTLLSVAASPGDRVATGDLLATVDARQIEAAIAAAEEKVAAARAAVTQAQSDSERLQTLYEEDLIALVRTERARVRLDELEAQQQAAQSELEAQQANLSYTRLTAPFDGIVSETLVDSGSFVGPGQPLLIIEDRREMRIDVPISDIRADSLTPGQSLSLITGPDQKILEARLVGVIPALTDAGTGQRLRLTLDAGKTALAPGEVVSVVVPVTDTQQQKRDNTRVGLPESALIRRGQLTGVLVVKAPSEEASNRSAVINLRWIKTARAQASATRLIPVTEGLEAGERVVVNPSPDLRDGQSVIIGPSGATNGEG